MKYSPLVARVAGEGADAWEVHARARAALERGEDVILLSVGDPDLPPPAGVIARAVEALRAGDNHYTPASGRPALREAIAAQHRARTGQAVGAGNAVFLAGVQNALFACSLCLAGQGDEVLALEPLYPTYTATIEASGARMVRVAAGPGFRVDLAALERLVTPRTRALLYASPGNPSGVILSPEELDTIGELARRHGFWVVADEVYAGLAPGGQVPGLAARLPDQVVTLGSLSKTHSMAGWRAGWLVGPEELVTHVEALALCMLYGLPGFIQEAAECALGVAAAAEAGMREFCELRRALLLAELAGIEGIVPHAPQAGMFILVDVRGTGLSGREFMHELYGTEGVSVLDGGAFGRDTRGFVRICFAADQAAIVEACRRIRRFVAMNSGDRLSARPAMKATSATRGT